MVETRSGGGTPEKLRAGGAKPKSQSLGAKLKAAGAKALGGGIAGAVAMVVQVFALMWLRTTINYQHSKGVGTWEALSALWSEGGIPRFYRGVWYALLQGPLSRFGDTAANAGMLALLENVASMSAATKTFAASIAAALFRILLTPIDTLKTTLQVQGAEGMAILSRRISEEGFLTMYSGAIGTSVATLMGHYPWFVTHNFINDKWKEGGWWKTPTGKQVRRALIGLCSSFVSDVVSNGMRVVKTAKQTSPVPISYLGTVQQILAEGGLTALLFRGLGTKIISNGIQAMLFTICWKYMERVIADYMSKKKGTKKSE